MRSPAPTVAAVLATVLLAGCYRSHERAAPEPRDGGLDAHAAPDATARDASTPDAGPPEPDAGRGPCATDCEAPRLLASVSFTDALLEPWAVLDLSSAGDSLVALFSVGDLSLTGAGTRLDYRLLHVPLVSGVPRFEGHRDLFTDQAVAGGSLRPVGEGVRLVALRSMSSHVTDPQAVSVVIATWPRAGVAPEVALVPLREGTIPGCTRCYRYGGAVVQDETHAIAAVAGDAELHVARIAFSDLSVERWTVPLTGASTDAPAAGASDGRGRALLTAGGAIAEFRGSHGGSAFALPMDGASVAEPLEVPGGAFDPPPRAIFFPDRAELVRFSFGADGTTGALRRWIVESGALVEQAAIETGAGLPPLAMTTTEGALLWAEVDLALPGAAILRALAHSPLCTSERAATVAHLPAPLADLDPRVIAATEHDGRTYALIVERRARGQYHATVLDLGRCRAVRP